MRSGLVVVGIVAFALASCATIPTGQDANAAVPMLQKQYDAWAWAVGIALIRADLVLPVPQPVVIAALGIIYGTVLGGLLGSVGLITGDLLGYVLSQLIVHHFMLGPGWQATCIGCSFSADHVEGALVHLEHHDVSVVNISRAPLAEIEAYKKRMGWRVPWVSSIGSNFNYDYHVSFRPEEIANGKVYYNYDMRDFQSEELSGCAFSLRVRTATSSTPARRHARNRNGCANRRRISSCLWARPNLPRRGASLGPTPPANPPAAGLRPAYRN